MGLPWISVFLTLFAAGSLLAVTSMPPAVIGPRFYRVIITTAMFLAVIAVLSSGVLAGDFGGARTWAAGYAAALAVYSMLVRVPLLPTSRPLLLALAAAGIAVAVAGLPDGGGIWGRLLASPASAAALGMALVAMLLGHSYLSSSNLSFDLLVDTCRVLIGTLAVRGLVSAAFFIPESGVLSSWMSGDVVLVLLVGVRYVVGIACAIVLAWMALACAKIRSNQSATGILYVAMGFVVMGELVAAYIMGDKGLAL